ncbi:MAG: multicopper oxidase domain-containing protein [Gemmatimonadaceae bacterium]|nr:multicopper oxidase domain-containing protein [Gemmatimonadaceae bacterium]
MRLGSHRRARMLLLGAPLLLSSTRPHLTLPDATTNDHRVIAGALRNGEYTLALELRRAAWHPNAPIALAVDVPVFAEVGHAPSIPGPLIRVAAGTAMRITVTNALATPATVHGLHDHTAGRDSIVLSAGETRTLRFVARAPGTFAYFARTNDAPTLFSRRDDSQLMGAFIVDAPRTDVRSANARERLLIITAWDDSVANPASPYGPRQVYAINGRSWPSTERLAYDHGDSIRWRVLNLSQHTHPMHLHGTYFRVLARGTPFADTTLGTRAKLVVTEWLPAGATMTMAWKADRVGNWLFHCHTINHIDEALRLGDAATPRAHTDHSEVTDAMAGLVMGISVRSRGAAAPRVAVSRRQLRLFVTERASPANGHPSLSYVLQRGPHEPASDSVELPGSTLDLVQGEPTTITVVNRSRQHTAVHWHGMELESVYDGVAGWSGVGRALAPIIAPGDSFAVQMTPPRAGTFIYHTHAGELAQLTGGLYGAMIVRPRTGAPTPERVVVLADSITLPLAGRTPVSMINGASEPAPIDLAAGVTHRLRLISIGAVSRKQVRLLDGDRVLRWTPVAKDGAEYPSAQRNEVSADQILAAGETMDVLVTPPTPGRWALEVTSVYGPPIITRVLLRVQ